MTSSNNPLHQASFYEIKYFFKNAREMFIEQIIEFELRSPGPLGRTCNLKTSYFHDKTKTFNRLRAFGIKATSAEA